MNESYGDELSALRHEIRSGGARPAMIDKSVSKLVSFGDKHLANDLLALLSDKAEYDEGMFSLIHAAESFDDKSYIQALLSAFPKLLESSPRWASIVLMRVLNNDQARLEAVKQLHDADASIRQSVRIACERINEISPLFLSKTTPIYLASA